MAFADSIQARQKSSDLREILKQIRYNRDLYKMLANIDKMISELSSLEVEARRTKKPGILDGKRKDLEQAIDYLEKLIMIMRLTD